MKVRFREATLAGAVTAGALALQVGRHLHEIRGYAVPALPAFDAYVYVAMAEHPTVFTVVPWGHRILTPWIARALPVSDLSLAFAVVTVASFAAACVLLFALQRLLGLRSWAAALGVAAFALSPPVGELIAAPYLAEPLACALLVALLVALEMDLDVASLALIATVGVLAKEVVALFLPVVYFARRGRGGPQAAHAVRDAAVVIGAAASAALLLRVVWTPGLRTPIPDLGAARLHLIAASLGAEPGRWAAVLAIGGITPVALAGMLRAAARPWLRRYGWVLAAALAQPLLAHYAIQQVVGEMNRYLLYAVPALVPFAVLALDRVLPCLGGRDDGRTAPRAVSWSAAAATLLAIALPLVVVDRYRRLDLQGRRDGLYVLGFCRGTWSTARKLRDGSAVLLRMNERRFAPEGFDPELLDRMRWFLRDGWGASPHYGTGEVVMQADRATLVLPCLEAAPLELTLAMSAPAETSVGVSVNGRPLGAGLVGRARTRLRFDVPADALFRGDNLVTLEVSPAAASRPRVDTVTYSPVRPPAGGPTP